MAFFSRFRRQEQPAPAAGPRAAVQPESPQQVITTPWQLEDALRSSSLGDSAGIPVTPNTAMRVSTVYACVRIIAGATANLPLDVKRRVNDQVRENASDVPLWRVLRKRPNTWQTPSQFKRMMQSHLLLRGNAYALIVRSGRRVIGLNPLDPDRMRVDQNDDLTLSYTYQTRNGGFVTLAAPDVFHLVGLTLDGVHGLSPISFARESLGLSMAQERHGGATFRNAARPSLVLSHPHRLGQEGIDHLKSSLDDYRSGGGSEGKALILEEGMEAKPLSMSAQDAQWIEARKFSRTDIAMFFGVPPHMIGDTDKATSWGSGIEQQSIGFVTYTLEDHLTTWEETVNRDLITENELYAKFNRSALLRGDIDARWSAHVRAMQWGVMSPNEVRTREDMNPRDGGDVYYDPPNTAGGQNQGGTGNDPSQSS